MSLGFFSLAKKLSRSLFHMPRLDFLPRYYYLPWTPFKPYVSVECAWEDVVHRLEARNQLLFIADALKVHHFF